MLPSVVSALTGGDGGVLGLEPLRRAAVLLVDGLGWHQLHAHADLAPVLVRATSRRLTAGCPATTATSLASLGTGLPPGGHGVVGYRTVVPGTDRVLAALRWDRHVDPREWQPEPTCFERAVAAGVTVTRVGPAAFDGAGLTEAAMRGGTYAGAEGIGERIAATAAGLAGLADSRPALAYCYVGDLDSAGHRHGVDSPAWRHELAHVDRLVEQLAAALPADATLWVTADHGMVDVPRTAHVDLAAHPELSSGVRVVTGEPRARYVHARPGAAGDVLATWSGLLGDRMDVRTRDDAIAAGWFGPVAEHIAPRIGDVVALATGSVAVVDSRERAGGSTLVGQHGSITPAELDVPLVQLPGGS